MNKEFHGHIPKQLNEQIQVHGTIGIIIRSVRRNQKTMSDVIEIIRSIPEKSSLHINPSLLKKILKQLDDENK